MDIKANTVKTLRKAITMANDHEEPNNIILSSDHPYVFENCVFDDHYGKCALPAIRKEITLIKEDHNSNKPILFVRASEEKFRFITNYGKLTIKDKIFLQNGYLKGGRGGGSELGGAGGGGAGLGGAIFNAGKLYLIGIGLIDCRAEGGAGGDLMPLRAGGGGGGISHNGRNGRYHDIKAQIGYGKGGDGGGINGGGGGHAWQYDAGEPGADGAIGGGGGGAGDSNCERCPAVPGGRGGFGGGGGGSGSIGKPENFLAFWTYGKGCPGGDGGFGGGGGGAPKIDLFQSLKVKYYPGGNSEFGGGKGGNGSSKLLMGGSGGGGGGAGLGGAIFNYKGEINIKNSFFDKNYAIGGRGGKLENKGESGKGFGNDIFNYYGTVDIDKGTNVEDIYNYKGIVRKITV